MLGIAADDLVYSAAKLFFAYGLGNAMTFPMSVGATSVLYAGRPTPEAVFDIFAKFRPTRIRRRADALCGAQRPAGKRRG